MGHIRTISYALSLVLAITCVLVSASPALADGGRVVPAARSFPRAFSTYDDLVSFATQIAHDQTALDADLERTHADGLAAADRLVPAPWSFGLRIGVDAHAERVVQRDLRATLAELAAHEQALVAAGARLERSPGPWTVPLQGELTQPFGPTDVWLEPSGTWQGVSYAHFHNGVDIAAPWGTPVVAAADGRVAFAGYMSDGAMVVVLAHDGGRVSLYAHLADGEGYAPPVAAGQTVKAGDRIGSIGLTGMSTGPHLHWSAYADGALVDPLSLTR